MRSGVIVSLILATASTGRADLLDQINARGKFIWGGDQEGGGPYVYPDPADPARVTGFEVELASLLAGDLGVAAEYSQGDWNTLPELLRTGHIDLILNGYEWTASRAARMSCTRPYYIYELQLLAPDRTDAIREWEDLRARSDHPRAQVAVLRGTSAEQYLRDHWGDDVEIVGYDGNTDAMAQVRNGLHAATLADLPVAIFYRNRPQGRGLRFVDDPVAPGYYVIYTRLGEHRLVDALNTAIERALADGRLRALYEKYDLWTTAQEKLPDARLAASADGGVSGWFILTQYGPVMLRAAGMTVQLSVLSMPLAILLGLFVALGRLYGPGWLRGALACYVEVLRGTPVMLQLYVLYFLLPEISPIALSPVVAAVTGLAINYSAYEAEIYRAGLQAIPRGQLEAALALGMSRATALRRVVVPQAVRLVVPPVTNDFIALFKDTSVCSVIAVTELTKQYNVMANSTGQILPLAAMTALLYLAMSYPLSLLTRRLECRSDTKPAGGTA
jgi:polar amino acid transport system substrate-binding protein